MYAAWLTAGDDEDYLPFTVRPPRGTARSKIAVLMSTVTYTVYENFTDIGVSAWRDPNWQADPVAAPLADNTIFRDVYGYIEQNALFGLYDIHVDGHGVAYGSMLKPMLNMRPKFRYRTMNCPARFPADLYLVDWLDQKGFDVDYITDHDLHAEGADLLRPYAVVLSSSHHEYWTSPMLDSLETYLAEGGRFMYIGGNSLFGVTSIDPAKPHRSRCGAGARRGRSSCRPPSGTTRRPGSRAESGRTAAARRTRSWASGRPGRASTGARRTSGCRDSYDPRAAWIFDGVEGDLIGDSPNLQVKWGAAGYEFDRVDYELGSPGTTLLLASSVRFNASHRTMLDEELYFIPGRDGNAPHRPAGSRAGPPLRAVGPRVPRVSQWRRRVLRRCDLLARRALRRTTTENTVSQVTENVLRRFADPAWRRG